MRAKQSIFLLLAMMLMLLAIFPGQSALAETTNQPSQTVGTAVPPASTAVPTQRSDTPVPTSGAETPVDVSERLGFFIQQYGLVVVLLVVAAAALVVLIVMLVRSKKKKRTEETNAQTKPDADEICGCPAPPPPAVCQVGNVHHVGKRAYQQDAFGVSPMQNTELTQRKGVLAVLADGMGGMTNSGELSQAAVLTALNSFPKAPFPTSEMLASIAHSVLDMVQKRFAGSGAGSTLILASIRDGKLDYLTIGDSRIALWRSDALLTLNREHNYAATLRHQAALGATPWREVTENPRRRALTSYLGMETDPMMDFPAEPIRLLPGDKVVLMTDGVFGTLDDETLGRLLMNDAVKAAETIESFVLTQDKQNQDNFTAVILEIR